MTTLLPGLVGLSLGMRHALEPDHLAAVSTLASSERGRFAGVKLGLFWGLGHTLSLTLVGGPLAFFGAHMPARLEQTFELLVAVMVVGLGLRAVAKAIAEGREGAEHTHEHGGEPHTHVAPSEHLHVSQWTLATRPVLIGVMHGLAGSGALTTMVMLELPTTSSRLAYIALFGAGSIVGMALLTGLAGVPLMKVSRMPKVATALLLVTGLVSTGIGAWWGVASLQSLLAA